ncbi:hypothetical protein J4G33_13595 [Actinotalea sp. BY-33]|uniref:Uncharacterized protein n=1 Tax=Actinotalea soli TaxID=2819234 RepID=A0A939RSX8_9CELL|nr:hypothetical protein [Actinotalea soli]MBO1752842.1 hypothetical protein [Actinotalea soli]
MIFFGWGRKSKSAQVSAEQALALTYSYVHIFWLFQLAFKQRYSVATWTEAGWATRELSDQEAMAGGAPSTVTLHWWWRFGLVLAIAFLVVALTFAGLAGS